MNWGEIKNAVRHYLENREDTFNSHFPDFARFAEEDIYRDVQLPVAKQLATSAVIISDRYLSLPPEALSIYSLTYRNEETGEDVFVLPKDFAFLKEAYPNRSVVGPPRFYGYRDEGVVMVVPTPGQNYAMEMHYFTRPDSISKDDEDTNVTWLSQNGETALIFGIVMHGYIYEKGDQDVVAMYKGEFDKAVANLKLIAEGRQRKDSYRTVEPRLPA